LLLVALSITEYLGIEVRKAIAIPAIILLGVALSGTKYFDPGSLYSRLSELNEVKGTVASYPVKTKNGTELTLRPDDYRGKLKVYLEGEKNSETVGYGDKITVRGKFEAPAVFGDFDYREFLRKRGIWGLVYRGEILESREEFGNPVLEFGWKLRSVISGRIEESLPERGHFLKALLFGTREILNDRTEKSFTETGLAHLLAASGLHLGIILGVTWWIAARFGLGRKTTYTVSLPLVLSYLVIVGFKLPMLRASLIYFFGGAHIWLKDRGIILEDWYDRYQALAGAALVLVVINPENVSTVGFQLSFGATFALALFFQPMNKALPIKPDYLGGVLSASLSAQMGVLPVLAVHFGRIHPWAPLVNLIAIPGVTATLYLGILALTFGQGLGFLSLIGPLTSKVILVFRNLVRKISTLPLAAVGVPSPTPLFLISYFILVYWLKRKLTCREKRDFGPREKLERKT